MVVTAPALATEYGFGDYGLGYGIPMPGYTPPPGVYFSDTFYLYSASATTNGNFPFGNIKAAGVKVNFITNIAATAWYSDVKIFGGTLGFGAAVPVGSDMNSAAVSFIGPLGFNRQLNRTDSVVSIGDSAYSASLGWEAGEHHWNVALIGFAPTGHYAPDSLAIMGLNRPGFDIKGAYTFLSTQTGSKLKLDAGWRAGLLAEVPFVDKRTTTFESSDSGNSAEVDNRLAQARASDARRQRDTSVHQERNRP